MSRTVVLRELALSYARRGWHVFPCQVDGKPPATRSGFRAATNSYEQISQWWRTTPYNIGIWTGQSSLVVMDCDLKVGTTRWRADDFEPYSEIPDHDLPITSGLATWLGILADRGLDWLPTYTVLTPSMGCHVYFSYDGEDIHPAVSWREALDVRAGGSYVVAAGSFIEDTRYELITNPFNEVMPIPSWLRDLLEQETIPASDGEIANPRPGSLKADLKDSRHLRNLE